MISAIWPVLPSDPARNDFEPIGGVGRVGRRHFTVGQEDDVPADLATIGTGEIAATEHPLRRDQPQTPDHAHIEIGRTDRD